MHTKKEINEIVKDDPETACCYLIDMIEMIFEAGDEEREDLRDEWNSETISEFLDFDQEEIEEFFEKYKWEEKHGYKIQT